MHTQDKRSWVLLTSFAACAGLATAPAFAVEPYALMELVQVDALQYFGGSVSNTALSVLDDGESELRMRSSFVSKNADVQAPFDEQPREIDHSAYLIKLLQGSSQFRVRAQAAVALGAVAKPLAARAALTAALRDEHPAVRAAAATSLGRIGDASDVHALRTLETDPEEPVRNAARASIDKIERTITEPPAALDTACAKHPRRASHADLSDDRARDTDSLVGRGRRQFTLSFKMV